MKKNMMLCLLSLLIAMGAEAQEVRNVVYTTGINELQYTKKESKPTAGEVIGEVLSALITGETTQDMDKYVDAVQAAVVKGISQARRIKAIDGQLTPEEKEQPHTWYVDGTIGSISATSKVDTWEDKDKKKHSRTVYKGLVSVTLHFKDAHTDEVLFSPSFNVTASDLSWVESASGAVSNAINSLPGRITRYLNVNLPLSANIIEGARDKKDKQKEVYIDLGEAEGGFKGLHFDVFTVKTVAGREAKKKIGRLKVTDVEGEDISLCKVQSGGRDIKTAIDAGEQLLIITTD